MKTSTLMRVKCADGVTRVIDSDGQILASENPAENLQKVRSITFGNQEDVELMLPAGMELENETAQPVQANVSDVELLLPCGFQLNQDGTISTPQDRQKKIEIKERKAESKSNNGSELMLPAGIELES